MRIKGAPWNPENGEKFAVPHYEFRISTRDRLKLSLIHICNLNTCHYPHPLLGHSLNHSSQPPLKIHWLVGWLVESDHGGRSFIVGSDRFPDCGISANTCGRRCEHPRYKPHMEADVRHLRVLHAGPPPPSLNIHSFRHPLSTNPLHSSHSFPLDSIRVIHVTPVTLQRYVNTHPYAPYHYQRIPPLPFLQLGFSLLEAGTVRFKNTRSIMVKNVLDTCVCALAFWLFGYAIAFGDGSKIVGWMRPSDYVSVSSRTARWRPTHVPRVTCHVSRGMWHMGDSGIRATCRPLLTSIRARHI